MKIKSTQILVASITIVLIFLTYSILTIQTLSEDELSNSASEYCKDYDGVKVASESLLRVSILCNKVAGKRLWWNTYEGTSIDLDEKVIKDSISNIIFNGMFFLIPLILVYEFLGIKETFVKSKENEGGKK